jgi:hypothetical protein
MIAALSLMIAAPAQGLPANDRLGVFLDRSPFLQVKADVSLEAPDGKTELSFVYHRRNGADQFLQVTHAKGKDEWRQNKGRAIFRSEPDELYDEFGDLPPLTPPPGESSFFLSAVYPFNLTSGPGSFAQQKDLKVAGDKMTLTVTDPMGGTAAYVMTVDGQGRPLTFSVERTGMDASLMKMTYRQVEQGAPPEESFNVEPPLGWMPVAIKERTPISILSRPPNLSFVDGGTGKSETLQGMINGGGPEGTVLIFTSAQCLPSAELRRALPGMVATIKAARLGVTEVVLGDGKLPLIPGIPQRHDSGRVLEDGLRIPSTPFLLTFDRKLTVRGAYASFGAGERDPLIKAVTKLAPLPGQEKPKGP